MLVSGKSKILLAVSALVLLNLQVPLSHADPVDIKKSIEKNVKTDIKQESKDKKDKAPAPEKEENTNSYRVGPDDKLKITIFGEDDLSGIYTVSAHGTISMPLIDEIEVEDHGLGQIKNTIAHKLSEGYLVNPSVSIEVETYRPFYILGEVRAPGSYSYVSDMSVLNAVALAGGFTYRANKNRIEIMRSRKGEATMLKEQPAESAVQPGDIILIKERFF